MEPDNTCATRSPGAGSSVSWDGAGVSTTCDLHSAEGVSDNHYDLSISFSCGGWFQMYFFGVAHALVDSGLLDRWRAEGKRVRFCGSSAGSLAALCLASEQYDFEAIRDYAADAAMLYRSSIWNLFSMKTYLEDSIDVFGRHLRRIDTDPVMRAHMESGVLEVAMTVLPRLRPKTVNSFHSYEQLHESILASCCMVPLVGMPFRLQETGEWVADGGLSNFTPRSSDPNCISVSAMYFQDATIRPRVFVPSWWVMRPPSDSKYRNLFWMGYNDAIDSFVSMGMLDTETGELLLKPETDFRVHDSFLDVLFTIVAEITLLICLKPFTILCVYGELALSLAWYAVKSVFLLDDDALVSLYESFRSAVSLRTLGRLVFGSSVPNNEERLWKRSRAFRFFDPMTLGGTRRTGRECWSPQGSPVGTGPSLSPKARRLAEWVGNGAGL